MNLNPFARVNHARPWESKSVSKPTIKAEERAKEATNVLSAPLETLSIRQATAI
jgi:hypothetical protein